MDSIYDGYGDWTITKWYDSSHLYSGTAVHNLCGEQYYVSHTKIFELSRRLDAWVANHACPRGALTYGTYYHAATEKLETKKDKSMRIIQSKEKIQRDLDRLEAEKDRLVQEQLRLDLLPKEPNLFDDGTGVVFFRIKFPNNIVYYSYSAVYVDSGSGRWWVTGPTQKNNGGYTWEELVEWITSFPKWEIWSVTEMVQVDASE